MAAKAANNKIAPAPSLSDINNISKAKGGRGHHGNRPFPLMGITLQAIKEFVERIGGKETLKDLTTTEVCEKYIIPLTQVTSPSYHSPYLKIPAVIPS